MAAARPEAELLLCCGRARMDPDTAARVKALLRREIDWDYLLPTALRHGMMPLLYWHLDAVCPDAVPGTILGRLRDHFKRNALRNMFLTGELCRVLSLLEGRGIPAIPFKGPPLAAAVYGNVALREFVDLDVLVPKRDVLRAKEVLASQGYRPELQLSRAQEAAYLESNHDYVLVHESGVVVEIHWAFAPRYFPLALDPEQLWERAERIPLVGATVPSLSPEDLLLILCVHGSKHAWERLEWICGVSELVRGYGGMDWGRVIGQADTVGGARMLFLGLFLASELLGAALPEAVSSRIEADPPIKALARQVRRRLFRETADRPPIAHLSPGEIAFHLGVRERLQDKLQYCLRLALSPSVEDRAMLSLPVRLSFLYYPLRPVRLAGKWLIGSFGPNRFRHSFGTAKAGPPS
jgi:hypothetical protein